jgi:hypothetical protein
LVELLLLLVSSPKRRLSLALGRHVVFTVQCPLPACFLDDAVCFILLAGLLFAQLFCVPCLLALGRRRWVHTVALTVSPCRYAELLTKKKERDAQKLPALVMDRLGMLLYRGPTGSERKHYEKTVVEWVQDSLVKKCPDCGEGFGFTRRRHHCRLCGGVVCAPCSETIDVPEAAAMVKETARARGNKEFETATLACDPATAVRACGNCCRIAERAHRSATKLAQFVAQRDGATQQMAQVWSYYQVCLVTKFRALPLFF